MGPTFGYSMSMSDFIDSFTDALNDQDAVNSFEGRGELLALAATFIEHHASRGVAAAEAVAAAQAAAAEAAQAQAPPPPVEAWADGAGAAGAKTADEWKPPVFDAKNAFATFAQSPQQARRGSATKPRAGRASGRRSAPRRGVAAAGGEEEVPAAPVPVLGESSAQFGFNFGALNIGEEPGGGGGGGGGGGYNDAEVADMDMEKTPQVADTPRAPGRSPVRASVPPPGKPPASGAGESDAFVSPAVPLAEVLPEPPGLTTASVPQFNMGAASRGRESRKGTRRKPRQRDGSGQDTSPSAAPPVVFDYIDGDSVRAQSSSTLPENPSERAKLDEVSCPLSCCRDWSHAARVRAPHPVFAVAEQADRQRKEGNDAYKSSDYHGAVAAYRCGCSFLPACLPACCLPACVPALICWPGRPKTDP